MPRRQSIPAYRLHQASGQAIVTLPDGLGHRRDVYLGKYGTPESRTEYGRVIAEWEATGRRLPQSSRKAADLTVNELLIAYWTHAEEYYRFKERKHCGQAYCLKDALRVVKKLYGDTPAADFGPLALKTCRQQMVETGWSRRYINAQVDRIRRAFRWAAAEEMVAGQVYQNLRAVEGLRKGKTTAREGKKVKPVPQEYIDATLPFVRPVIRAMVQFQQLTGCRPGELCLIRPIDLDMSDSSCWVFSPDRHKTAHHEQERHILIGPRAQEVIRPYLGTRLDAYCFSPAESEAQRNAQKRAARKTPLTPSQRARKPLDSPKRAKRDHYDETSYRNAIYRACDKAFPPPEPLARRKGETAQEWKERLTEVQKEELARWRKEHRWHPNRLRHNRATELRCHGLDMVKTILGHTKVETSQIYAEKDLAAARELVAKIG
jgi:integrase